MASVTVLAIVGVVFEVGRRLGQSKEQRNQTETSLDEMETRMEERFNSLERKIDHESAIREREHAVVIEWLGSLTDTLKDEGYDVERPPEVTEGLDINDPGNRDVDPTDD